MAPAFFPVPAGQFKQSLPAVVEYFPALHWMHVLVLGSPVVPAGHEIHPFPNIIYHTKRELMNSHPLIGESILAASQSEEHEMGLISTAIKVAGYHHEKWDGSGYPRNLQGEDIPIEARIMAVADVFDALISDRPYKKGWTIEEAYSEIITNSGTSYDPIVVEAFIAERRNFQNVAESH